MSTPIKLFLSTPCYGGLCLEKYFTGIVKLQLELMREGIQLYLDTTENESLVHRARNVSVGRFMQKTDCDFFMFIDADIDFDAPSVVRLVRENREYPRLLPEEDGHVGPAKAAVEKGDERDMSMLSSSLVINLAPRIDLSKTV